jgi:hypothetical protein
LACDCRIVFNDFSRGMETIAKINYFESFVLPIDFNQRKIAAKNNKSENN